MMKKLNRKGFTLIELLAVIVIMAIILVVTVPNIIQSINDARVSSIHNLAVSIANTYNNAYAQDLIATASNKTLGNIPEKITDKWQCIGDFAPTADGGSLNTTKNLATVLGLNKEDIILDGTEPSTTNAALTSTEKAAIKSTSGSETCSAIRLRNGVAEVVLVAANGGRFYVAQKYTYAVNTDVAGAQNNATS